MEKAVEFSVLFYLGRVLYSQKSKRIICNRNGERRRKMMKMETGVLGVDLAF